MKAPKIHAIVVTHRGADMLPACLRALEADVRQGAAEVEIVVVDNASTDGTESILRADFPQATVLRLPENAGYGRANNVALRRALAAGADYAALVNDDVEVRPGWLSALVQAATLHPEAGLLNGTLVFRGEDRVNSTGLVIDRLGRARDRDFGVPLADLRRDLAAYFAYYEDVDLSLRARRAGSICWYVPGAVADHRFASTVGAGSARQRYLLGRGHLRTLALHQPAFRAVALVPLTAAFRLAVKSPLELLRGRPDLAAAEARAGIDGARAALLALPIRVRAGIPRGAEPR